MVSSTCATSGAWNCLWILLSLILASLVVPYVSAKPTNSTSNEQRVLPENLITEAPVTKDSTTIVATPTNTTNQDITVGSCIWAIGRKCPDKDVEFYLYTRRNAKIRQPIVVYTNGTSNLTKSFFDKSHATKIILHGYNADMFLHSLHSIKDGEYNIFYVDWSKLALGPCYINAVYNIRHVGSCVAQLVKNILAEDNSDVHIIGFSLGAQLANYIARDLGTHRLQRITGLDPALPLFITSSKEEKLDASDALYVDVMHTNALVQGKFEQCGHSDVYMNGGIFQPDCMDENPLNPFPCFHHRAIEYFVESIRSPAGFWAWPCSSYLSYLLGMCPPTNNLVEIGANIKDTTKGMHFVYTNGKIPYAMGKWTNTDGVASTTTMTITQPPPSTDPLLRRIDEWGKLDYNFNNIDRQKPTR